MPYRVCNPSDEHHPPDISRTGIKIDKDGQCIEAAQTVEAGGLSPFVIVLVLSRRRTSEMTRSEILASYGIVDHPNLIIEALKPDALWRVRISGEGNPLTAAIDAGGALKLANELRKVGEEKLANRIVIETERAHRYIVTGP
jgi:hypothetical protein